MLPKVTDLTEDTSKDESETPKDTQGQPSQPVEATQGPPSQAQGDQPATPPASPKPASQPTQDGGRRGWETEDRKIPTLFPWENLVRLRENKRREAIDYLVKRDNPFCVFCTGPIVKRPDGKWDTDIDHIDRNTRNNKRWNIRLSHHGCNATDGNNLRQSQPAPSLPATLESERESSVGTEAVSEAIGSGKVGEYAFRSTRPWKNREGEKHDQERPGWNKWIRDLENGPFYGIGAFVSLDALSKMAVHGVGMGSSKTYRVFAEEDQFGKHRGEPGILEIYKENGVKMVRYRGPSKIVKVEAQVVTKTDDDSRMEEDDD